MSIQTELTRITNAKAAIKTAIEGKGVTVPGTTLLDGMASLIESIEAGGGSFDLSNFLKNITDVVSFSFTPIRDGAGYLMYKPSINSIPRMGFVYAKNVTYAYNKSILCFWLYTAIDPYTDVSRGTNLQAHVYTASQSAFAIRLHSEILITNGGTAGCLSSANTLNYIQIKSQTTTNNEAIFKAGVQYCGFVFFGD